ncbi:MAG: hypothetical protein K5905_05490 [Roseibium sp.]|uniref:hypothetical protein n=1 Tax=Roseibium sp. TaxID=1936156 RepID=UPI0026249292|nr:hypothetical protein [Roseibium sp.]MCV0424900.1 hypothetical protein [Roseibium sp.]
MSISAKSQIVAFVIIFPGAVYFFVSTPPFIANVIFVTLCVMWSAWIFISIFRGPDELKSASIRYALAVASGVGVPLTLAFVMLMIATPDIQRAITSIAAYSGSGLSPATVGFGLGVTFSLVTLCAVFMISHSVWWVSKR